MRLGMSGTAIIDVYLCSSVFIWFMAVMAVLALFKAGNNRGLSY